MNQLYIPEVNDKIKLTHDLSVQIKDEYRNRKFLENYLEAHPSIKPEKDKSLKIVIPKGVILTFSRIYVRQGDSSDYNSITFTTDKSSNFVKGRFFITLAEANNIQYERVAVTSEKITLKRALSRKSKELRESMDWREWYKSEHKTYEEVLKGLEPVYSTAITYSYQRVISFLKPVVSHLNESNLQDKLREIESDLGDTTIECLNLDAYYSHGEFAIKISRKEPIDDRVDELIRILQNRTSAFSQTLKVADEQTYFIKRHFYEDNDNWDIYPEFKSRAQDARLEEVLSIVMFGGDNYPDLKKRLTKIKRQENKK